MSTPNRRSSTKTIDSWSNSYVWVVLDPPNGIWKPGIVVRHKPVDVDTGEKVFTISVEDNTHEVKTVSVDKHNLEFKWVKKRDKISENSRHVEDMTSLPFLNEPEMIACMRLRFQEKKIYTNTGPILLAINPFERLPLYSTETLQSYYEANPATCKHLGPHVYQISDRAYRKMFIDKYDPDKRENQSILVNGESGAGKTESTKQVLHYLAAVSSKVAVDVLNCNDSVDFESLVNAVNPITESFGNARTSRNNNSSRFGKFIELSYAADGYIEGAMIRTYLLETVRVVSQSKGERNYHVFYECFAGLPPSKLQEWGLRSLEDFHYTNRSGEYSRHDGESDEDNFKRLQEAMGRISLTQDEQDSMLRAVAAVLHIGNLSFDESATAGEEAAVFSKDCGSHINNICALLEVDEEALLTAVSKRSLVVAGSTIQKVLNVEGAIAARDALAKTLYDLLFKWMIDAVNRSLCSNNASSAASFIGVLDIFGFEFFKTNSFEQLCINYANEKLQDHFNYAVFKSEQEVYEEEGLVWTFVDYPDNSERLDLFEHKVTGIFALCNEQLKLPKPSDKKLASALFSKCGVKNFFNASKSDQSRLEFTVSHFACDVKYQCEGLLNKNRSDIASEISAAFQSSKSSLVAGLVKVEHTGPSLETSHSTSPKPRIKVAPGRSVGKRTTTVSSEFCKQLQVLVTKIRSTRSHFIRCIKPNNDLVPDVFDYSMVVSQLRCGGALEAVKVFRAGFPNRIDFSDFVSRYSVFIVVCGINPLTVDLCRCMDQARKTGLQKYWRMTTAKLIDTVCLTDAILHIVDNTTPDEAVNVHRGLQMGRSQVFLMAPVFEFLETLFVRAETMAARTIQRHFRARFFAKRHSVRAINHALLWFCEHKRRTAMRCVSATIILQRRIRVFLTVQYRKTVLRGITLFKARFRGYLGRQYVMRLRYCYAVCIQKSFRCYILSKRFLRMRTSAVTIQKIARRLYASLKLRYRKIAIVSIQSLWRGAVIRSKSHLKATILELKRQRERAAEKDALIAERRKRAEGLGTAGTSSVPYLALVDENRTLKKELAALRKQLRNTRVDSASKAAVHDDKIDTSLHVKEKLELKDQSFSLQEEHSRIKSKLHKSPSKTEGSAVDSGDALIQSISSSRNNLDALKTELDAIIREYKATQEEVGVSTADLAALKQELRDILKERSSVEADLSIAKSNVTLQQEHSSAPAEPPDHYTTYPVQAARILELENDNKMLTDDLLRVKEKYIALLGEFNGRGLHAISRNCKSIAKLDKRMTSARKSNVKHRVPTLIVNVTDVTRSSKTEARYQITVQRSEPSGKVISWTTYRTYREFRHLREALELKSEGVDEKFPSKSYSPFGLDDAVLENRRIMLDDYIHTICADSALMRRKHVYNNIIQFIGDGSV